MGIKVEDVTNRPRSEANIREALCVVEARMLQVTAGMADPELYMQFFVIRDALRELLALRSLVEAARKQARERMKG